MDSTRFDDPAVLALADTLGAQKGLPPGLLPAILTRGERSNSDQVSSAGAKTVAQITPSTRQLALNKYGIDAYLTTPTDADPTGQRNALEVAANLLKDSLDRNKGDASSAVREYIGGTNPDNWGPTTRAYVNRVMTGLKQTQSASLSDDFGKFMAANPAVPADSQRPQLQTQTAAPSALSQDFAAWKAQQDATPAAPPPPSALDKIVGAGEAALSTATGATTGYLGAMGGAIGSLFTGQDTNEAANQAGDALTYSPRTQAGKDETAAVGDLVNSTLVPVAGLAPELNILHAGISTTGSMARAAVAPAVDTLQRAATAAPDAVRGVAGRIATAVGLGDGETAPAPTAGTGGSVGAAGTDLAAQRRATAADLPVPIQLTEGQATRAFDQQRFEQETAKDPTNGQPLRDRQADQNAAIPQNFDRLIDMTGAEKVAPSDVGRAVVDEALVQDAAALKNKYRVQYKEAEKAGELAEPVSLQGVIDHLNEAAPEATTAPLLNTARNLAIKLGIAKDDGSGKLVMTTTNVVPAVVEAKELPIATRWGTQSLNKAATLADAPAVQKGFVRLFQAGAEGDVRKVGALQSGDLEALRSPLPGIRYTTSLEEAANLRNRYTDSPNVRYVDLPAAFAESLRVGPDNFKVDVPALNGEKSARPAPSSSGLYGTQTSQVPSPRMPSLEVQNGASLKTAEQLRQAINRNTDFEPTNIRQATIIKSLIDQATDGVGGDLYRKARETRSQFARLYEDNAVVSDLLNNRRGTADRKVALENVFRRTVLNGSEEDLQNLRRTLYASDSEAGRQAWRELQGATLRHLNDEATKGVATDIRGNPIVSPAKLNNAIRALDQSGKLDFVLGKKGAQTVRDINDIAKQVFTSPPGSVNHSNTASVILAALAEAGVSGSMTGLPIPVLSGLRVLAMHVKDRRIQQRVSQALGQAKASAKLKKPTAAPSRTVH